MMNNEPNATTSNNTSNCICTNPAYKAWDLCGSCVMSFNVSSNSALQAGVIDEGLSLLCSLFQVEGILIEISVGSIS